MLSIKPNSAFPLLQGRSYFSLLAGCLSPEELCRHSRAAGFSAVALNDENGVYGAVRFLKAARDEGIKPLIGVSFRRGGRRLFSAYVLNGDGWKRLCLVLSRFLAAEETAKGRLFGSDAWGASLDKGRDGACLERSRKGPAVHAFDGSSYDPVADLQDGGWNGLCVVSEERETLSRLRAACADPSAGIHAPAAGIHTLSAGIHAPPAGLYAALPYRRVEPGFLRWAQGLGLAPMAVNDGVFRDERERRLYRVLRAIGRNERVDDLPPEEEPSPAQALDAPEAYADFFRPYPEAVENARRLAEEADASCVLPPRYVFPAFRDLSDDEAYALLRRYCREGIVRRYPGASGSQTPAAAPTELDARLAGELELIRDKGFASYFLVVRDIVASFPRTCGRGSAASSLVSYLLGITHVDPLRHKLFFERFLNRGRKDPPDIDVDFPWDERDRVLAFVFDSYPGRSAMVADHVTFGPRSSMREPARVLGFTQEEQGNLVRLWMRGKSDQVPPYLARLAKTLRGMPRNIGTHPGGVVITPGPITDHTTIQPTPLGWPVIAWEKDAAEDAGLVKIDLLGNRSLGVLRDVIELISPRREAVGEKKIAWDFDPLEDVETRRLIERGDTLGVFYVESPATRQLLKKMGAGSYEHLVVASSIIRPAANRWIKEYVRRLHGGSWEAIHPAVENTLSETLGIMVYQEDVARVAIAAAGFSAEEADQLRKVLTRKDRERKIGHYRDRFFEGARATGLKDKALETTWDMILSFSEYSFCKAHSASYALVSYRLAWIKKRYPLEFLVCVINNGGGFYGTQVYLNEIRRRGFRILGPDVNASAAKFRIEAPGAAACEPGAKPAARIGLARLSGMADGFLDRLLDERRKRGRFTGLENFLDRLAPGLAELRVLVRSGALDSAAAPGMPAAAPGMPAAAPGMPAAAGMTRPQIFWYAFHRLEGGRLSFRNCASGLRSLRKARGLPELPGPAGLAGSAATTPLLFDLAPELPPLGDYSPATKLVDEAETLGLVFSVHPLEIFRERIRRLSLRPGPPLVVSSELPARLGRAVRIAGTLVTGKQVRTKNRDLMLFLSFEDPISVFEAVLFPPAYEKYAALLDDTGAFLVTADVDEDFGVPILNISELRPLSRRLGKEVRHQTPAAGLPSGGIWGPPFGH